MITIVQGDATKPATDGRNIIVHGVNTIGAWGAGFVLAVDKISPLPRIRYRSWAKNKQTHCPFRKTLIPFRLGEIQLVTVKPKLVVCNLISQSGCVSQNENGEWYPPAKYPAIRDGLIQLRHAIAHIQVKLGLPIARITLHLPMIGAGLGGLVFGPIYEDIYRIFPGIFNIRVNIYGFTPEDYHNLKRIEKEAESRRNYLTQPIPVVQ